MRGKRDMLRAVILTARITPADAGKTLYHLYGCLPHEDHPRRCGENDSLEISQGLTMGSPPQMRGKLCAHNAVRWLVRITPADAGKTSSTIIGARNPKDHPRRCGENYFTSTAKSFFTGSPPQMRGKLIKSGTLTSLTGSPPQMRGKPFSINFTDIISGITPADAGKTGK